MTTLFVFALALAALLLSGRRACACTTVIVGKNASPTGCVIVGHNEDDSGRVSVRRGYVPAAEHAHLEVLPAEAGHAAIPQAEKTHGFYWVQMKKASGGMSTADSFLNDCGVLIVSDSCADSRENTEDASRLSEGGVGFNLRRIIAERASTAREAVEIAASILDRYGYVSSGRAYTAADANEAWMLQVVSGKHYAARRIGDDEAAFIPNNYTIHEIDFDDTENFIVSPGLKEYAISKGWYAPEQGPFDFARVFQAPESWMQPWNTYRSRAGYSLLMRRDFYSDESYPFSVKPPLPVGPELVMEILRSHYTGTVLDPQWARAPFPGGAPHDTEIRRICTGTTLESMVVVFGSRLENTVCWSSFGRPCELPYVPLHPLCGALPAVLSPMEDPSGELERHVLPDAARASWCGTEAQKFNDFQHLFELVYQEHEAEHERWIWSFENGLARAQNALTVNADALFESGRGEEARALIAQADAETAERVLSALASRRAALGEMSVTASPASASVSGGTVTFSFNPGAGRTPQEESLLLTMGTANARTQGIRPKAGSLKREGETWQFDVSASDLNTAEVAGTFDFWLGGRDEQGVSFGGGCLVTLTE